MRHLREKLNDRRGASILLAVMVMLVVSMVVAVMLNASLTATRRVNDDRVQEQNQLAADSAAILLRHSIEDSFCTITTVVTQVDDAAPVRYDPTYSGGGPMGFILRTAVASLDLTSGPYHVDVTPDNYQGRSALPSAALDFTMERYDNDGLGGGNVDKYLISGVVSVSGGMQKIRLTAWVPTVETRVRDVTTETEESVIRTTTTTQELRWSVDLSTGGHQ